MEDLIKRLHDYAGDLRAFEMRSRYADLLCEAADKLEELGKEAEYNMQLYQDAGVQMNAMGEQS